MSNGARGAPRRKIGAFRSTLGWVNLPCSKYFYRRRAREAKKNSVNSTLKIVFFSSWCLLCCLFYVLKGKINEYLRPLWL